MKSNALDDRVTSNNKARSSKWKMLLLGAGDSGKSTLFKQMVMLYGSPEERAMTPVYRLTYVDCLLENVVNDAVVLAEQSDEFGPAETPAGQAAVAYWQDFEGTVGTEGSPDELKQERKEHKPHLRDLWADPGIQKCYTFRANFNESNFNDSSGYFFDQLDTMFDPDYIPSVADILRVRIRTTGIVKHDFEIDQEQFEMYDVGGQRNERKKWMKCFDGTMDAVLFVASLSEFDQVLFEEQSTNRITEALNLFEMVMSDGYFPLNNSAVILFLNKSDLFKEKIKTKNITDSLCEELKQFTGDCRSFEETSTFIQDLFISKWKSKTDRPRYCHITCATDADSVKTVFDDVKAIIINSRSSALTLL